VQVPTPTVLPVRGKRKKRRPSGELCECRHCGHLGRGAQCSSCGRMARRRTTKEKKQHAANVREWKLKNKERFKAWEATHRDAIVLARLRHFAARNGYAPPAVADARELSNWLKHQPRYCRICLKSGVRLAIDHCHITGKLRGLLCPFCNARVVGLLEKHRNLLAAAERYLLDNC
jgi:recombination endonuclease VII